MCECAIELNVQPWYTRKIRVNVNWTCAETDSHSGNTCSAVVWEAYGSRAYMPMIYALLNPSSVPNKYWFAEKQLYISYLWILILKLYSARMCFFRCLLYCRLTMFTMYRMVCERAGFPVICVICVWICREFILYFYYTMSLTRIYYNVFVCLPSKGRRYSLQRRYGQLRFDSETLQWSRRFCFILVGVISRTT